MSTATIRTDEKQTETPRADSVNQAETLASIVSAVKQDSRQAAPLYLKQTEVPHGGE